MNKHNYHEEFTKVLYTIPQAAKIIHTNPAYVRKLVKSEALKALKLGEIKILSTELTNFLERNNGNDLSDPFNIVPFVDKDEK